MKKILNKLFENQKLTKEEAYDTLTKIASNEYNESQVAAFITVYLMRSISVEELAGFQEALLELCLKTEIDNKEVIDLCGTGGDGKNTFNISTLASFVVAGAGYKVTKHGNYGVSSACGSSNVLEYLGAKFTNDTLLLAKQLNNANICFLHAPLFHPALKSVAPIRKNLGVKTFFNMLGPLVNPVQPKQQLVGVFNLETARIYSYLLNAKNITFNIVHTLSGYDEISLTDSYKIINNEGEAIINPLEQFNVLLNEADVFGGFDIQSSAKIFTSILEGNGSEAQNKAVLVNAAYAINCFENTTINNCMEIAEKSLFNHNALKAFKKYINLN